jgi:hypothetical protein
LGIHRALREAAVCGCCPCPLQSKRGFLAVCTEEGMCECDVQVVSMIFSSGHDWSHQA